MSALHIVERIRKAGGDVVLADEKVVLRRRSRIPDELVAEARAHVDDLRALLQENEVVEYQPADPWDARLRASILLAAERIIAECCDHCGKRLCSEHAQ